ncbi:hypothetical protein [Leucobacter sp. OH1287]|uniref:hypothetical protein n=1 Tax=Leucobacter sp. OH1287 TaxID=2491049 RepID=UPI001315988E|nr:hypothetical protein [Leucobacter sp. OH1287]
MIRRLGTLVFGIFLGFVAAHFVNQSHAGRRFFDRINQATQELVDAVVNGYKDAE